MAKDLAQQDICGPRKICLVFSVAMFSSVESVTSPDSSFWLVVPLCYLYVVLTVSDAWFYRYTYYATVVCEGEK